MNTSENWSEMGSFAEVTAPRVFHLFLFLMLPAYGLREWPNRKTSLAAPAAVQR